MKKIIILALLFISFKSYSQTYNYHSLVTNAGFDFYTIVKNENAITVIKNKQGKPMEILTPSNIQTLGDKIVYSFANKEYQLSTYTNNLNILNVEQGEFSKSYFLDSHVLNPKLVKPLK